VIIKVINKVIIKVVKGDDYGHSRVIVTMTVNYSNTTLLAGMPSTLHSVQEFQDFLLK
jgi:hypothetical protein